MSDNPYEQELRARDQRQAQLDALVKIAMDRVASSIADRTPELHSHFFYGASAIHPRHLVTWYLFHTDADWDSARHSGLIATIEEYTRKELADAGYPANGIAEIMVSFTSHETIERETGGDYWEYFK